MSSYKEQTKERISRARRVLPSVVFDSMDSTAQAHVGYGLGLTAPRRQSITFWIDRCRDGSIFSYFSDVHYAEVSKLAGFNVRQLRPERLMAFLVIAASGRPAKVGRSGLIQRTNGGANKEWESWMDSLEANGIPKHFIGARAGLGNPAAKRDVIPETSNAAAEAEAASAMQTVGSVFDAFLGVKTPVESESAFNADDDELLNTMIGATPIIDDFDNEQEVQEVSAEVQEAAAPVVTRKRNRAKRRTG